MRKQSIAILLVMVALLILAGCGHEHTPGDWQNITGASCTEGGTRQKICTDCGEVLETEKLAATGHSEGAWAVGKEATCGEAGYRHKVCTLCGTETQRESLPALEHVPGNWTEFTKPGPKVAR